MRTRKQENYADLCSIAELRLRKEKLQRRIAMQEELITANAGQIRDSFRLVSLAGNLFSGFSGFGRVFGIGCQLFRFYKLLKRK